MEPALIVIGGVLLVAVVWLFATYNGLVGLRMHTRESFANIDAELQRRHDLIPNLVSIVKGYAAHEKEVLEQITALRGQAEAVLARARTAHNSAAVGAEISSIEQKLSGALSGLMVQVENYPDLKADQNFRQLMREVANTEDRIQAARRFHNGNIRDYNTRCETFPSNIVANWFGFKRAVFFECESALIRASIDVGGMLSR